MRRCLVVSILVFLTAFWSGCSWIRTATPEIEEKPSAALPATPSKVEPTPTPGKGSDAELTELYEKAKNMYISGVEQTQAGNFEEARKTNDVILKMLLQPYDRTKAPETVKKLDSLFFEVCLAQVRIGRLTGLYTPVPVQNKLIGIDFHPEVERWLQYYTVAGRDSMQRYLSHSTRYLPVLKKILKEEGVPEDLAYLPIIESGYSPYAYSPAAAVGIWQFVRTTGKNYGLTINDWVDERRDPIKATRAAAKYLKDLYGMFNDWALALAGYNCGENCVSRACQDAGNKDFWRLCLPAETMAYVPKFFAAVLIARDPEMYGMYVVPEEPFIVKQVELHGVVDLKQFGELIHISYEDLKALNPELLGSYTPRDVAVYRINVPADKYDEITTMLASVSEAQLYVPKEQVAKLDEPQAAGPKFISYRVKKGDTLGGIARRYHTSVNTLKKYNPKARGTLRVGMIIKIPVGRRR